MIEGIAKEKDVIAIKKSDGSWSRFLAAKALHFIEQEKSSLQFII